VSHLSDDVFDTGERETWITKTHLPTVQVRPQQLQYQTNIYIVVKSQLTVLHPKYTPQLSHSTEFIQSYFWLLNLTAPMIVHVRDFGNT